MLSSQQLAMVISTDFERTKLKEEHTMKLGSLEGTFLVPIWYMSRAILWLPSSCRIFPVRR